MERFHRLVKAFFFCPTSKGNKALSKGGGFSCSRHMVVEALAVSLDKPFPWAVGFFFVNTELSLELWNVIAGIPRFYD